jgi:hypothetical protein
MKKIIFLITLLIIASLFFFDAREINAVNPSDYGLKEGDLISAIFSDDPDVYIINEHGYKRLFLNPEIFNFYGHLGGFFNVKLVTQEVRDSFVTSGLFRDCESNDEKVYGVDIDGEDTGQLHWVDTTGEQAVSDDPDFFKKVFCINQKEFKWYPRGISLNTVKDVPRYDRMKEIAKIATKEKLEAKAELKDVGQAVICHYPPGNITAYHTLTVGASALKAHLNHGDTVGPCPVVASPSPTPSLTPTPSITPTPTFSPTPTPTPGDTTSPAISNIVASNITQTSASISWATDENVTSQVEYGTTSGVLSSTELATTVASGSTGFYSNKTSLKNLNSGITYYYKVKSTDTSGNTSVSAENTLALIVSNWSNNSLGVSGEYQSTAWNGNGYGVVYGWNGKLYFLKLDSSGNKLGEPVIVATAPNYVFWTNIVWDGSKYGVVWPEANPQNIRFATLDMDGNVLSNIAVTAGTDNANTERPAILWTGNEYILIWSGGWPDNFNNPYVPTKIIYFSKITSDGQTVIINKKKSITSGDARAANGPIVSAHLNGSSVGVLWQDIRESGDSNNPVLYFNILDNNGDKLISNDVKVSGAGRVGSPQIFADGANYIVFWRESTATDVNANSIYVAKLDSAGNKVLANQNLNTKGDNEIRPSVTKTDNGYGITWTSFPESRIYFKSINSNASIVIDNELTSSISGSNDSAYIVWGNNKYGVVWRNVQNNQSQLYFGTK